MSEQPIPEQTNLSGIQRAFILGILLIGVGFVGYAGMGFLNPPPLVPKIHVADAAKKLLRTYKGEPLSEPLENILSDSKHYWFESQAHPLLNQPAPKFELLDVDDHAQDLDSLLKKGTVVLIFYYGYHCDHCVSQLFDVNEDMRFFRELGAQVVAISADSPKQTLENYKQYGRFDFTVLSDPENKVAALYGTFEAKAPGKQERLDHGTFIISRDGRIRWTKRGSEPFRDNRTLLYEIAKSENRLPQVRPTSHTTK